MAEEMRLIDVGEFKKNLCHYCNTYMSEEPCEPGECWVHDVIASTDTEDAAPVVHGFNTYDHDSAFECSVCGFNDWDTLTADSGKYNYCPNCGAKMDGGDEGGKTDSQES